MDKLALMSQFLLCESGVDKKSDGLILQGTRQNVTGGGNVTVWGKMDAFFRWDCQSWMKCLKVGKMDALLCRDEVSQQRWT
jgi:hypothetical protein